VTGTKLEALTIEALRKALRFDDRVKLRTAKPSPSSLLAGSSTSASVNAAEAQCREQSLDLFRIDTVTETVRKKTTQVTYATITHSGIQHLLNSVDTEEYSELLIACAKTHAEILKRKMLPAIKYKLNAIDAQRESLRLEERGLIDSIRKFAHERLTKFEEENQYKSKIHEELSKLSQAVMNGEVISDETTGGSKPKNEMEIEFQRSVCVELAEELKDTPESRGAIERAFYIVGGMSPVGEVGDTVSFDGSVHMSTDQVYPGDVAIISQRGWQYETPSGEVLQLVRATVTAVTSNTSNEDDK